MSITASGVALAHVDIAPHIGILQLQWIMNGFILSFAACLLPAGSIVDRLSARRIFLWGSAILSGGIIFTVTAGSFGVLMLGRLLQGAGAALVSAAGPAELASSIEDDAQRKRAFGYLGASGGIGLTLGALLSGLVLDEGGWRSAFALHLPFAVASFCCARQGFSRRPIQAATRFDWGGALLSAIFITAAMVCSIFGPLLGWLSLPVICAFCIACVGGWAFVRCEARAAAPLLRVTVLRNRQFIVASGACVLFTTVWVALFVYVPLHMSVSYARSGDEVGTTMLALMVPALVMPLLASRCVQYVRVETVLAAGFSLMVFGLVLLFAAWSAHARAYEIAGLIICGAGAGSLYGLSDYFALSTVPPEHVGLASGAFNLLRLAGDALGTIVPAAVLVHTMRNLLADVAPVELLRPVLNELAAGRFDALDGLALDVGTSDLIRHTALECFHDGVLRAVIVLAAFAAAGMALVCVDRLAAGSRSAL